MNTIRQTEFLVLQSSSDGNSPLGGIFVGIFVLLVLAGVGWFIFRQMKDQDRRSTRDRLIREAKTGSEKELLLSSRSFLANEAAVLEDPPLLEAVITVLLRNNAAPEAGSLAAKGVKKHPGLPVFADLDVEALVSRKSLDQTSLDKLLAACLRRPERKEWLKRFAQGAIQASSTTVSTLKTLGEYYRETKDLKTLLYLAEVYEKKKIFSETSQFFFQEMLSREPANPRWSYSAARCQQSLGQFPEAEKTITACLDSNPGFQPGIALLKMIRGEEDPPPAPPSVTSASASPADPLSQQLPLPERYSQISELGRGGMGIVYKAFDEVLQRWVAIKVLQGGTGPELGEARERFLSESRVMACLDHPVIPKVFDVSVKPPMYISLEFLEGIDLRAHLEKNPEITLLQLVKFARQLAEGFHHAAEKGVLHRDIKPENIMIEFSGRVRILDFGLARLVQQKSTLTQAGLVVGTPWYMAPERLKGETATVFTEIFAFGVTLYEVINGKRPFDGDDYSVIFFQEPQSIRAQHPDCPLELEVLILDCLNKNPANRPRSFVEISKDLSRIQEKLEAQK
jgi:hypothetical protein